jgi:arginase
MTDRPERTFALIGAPSSAGAYAPGQEKAPAAFRRHGLSERLGTKGAVIDVGDVEGFRWRSDRENPKAMNLEPAARVARGVSDRVAKAMAEQHCAIVLGGDCSVELGTVAGAMADGAKIGLIYIDLDTDLNPPAQSDGALDWTGVAHMLGLPGTAPALSGLGPRVPMLRPDDLLFFGIDNVTEPEARTVEALKLGAVRLREVKTDPQAAGERAAAWAQRFDRLLVHLDVDVLSYVDFPIAENVRRQDGLTLDELARALGGILAAPNWRAITIAEVNPDHAPDETESFAQLIGALCGALP